MSRPSKQAELWMYEVAKIMVEENLNLRKAAESIGRMMIPAEAQAVERLVEFQKVYDQARYRYFEELGSDPRRTKNVLLGEMVYCARQLAKAGAYRDALDGMLKIAKVEFNVAEEGTSAVYGLNQEQIDAIKERIKAANSAELLPGIAEPASKPV